MSLERKIKDPSDVIVEKTAGEMAGVFYDAARSSGLTVIKLQNDNINLLRYKSPREFARRHLEKFIPAAVHALNEIMCRETTPPEQREVIYNAIMERVNDIDLMDLGRAAMLPEYEKSPLYKADTEKPKPVIINSTAFNFDSTRKPNG